MHALSELEKLPVELIYEIHLSTLSEAFPILNKWTREIFKSTHPSYRAEYIFLRYLSQSTLRDKQRGLVTYALQFPICSEDVLDAVLRLSKDDPGIQAELQDVVPQLPRRLFKSLNPRAAPARLSPTDAPLPFLRYLYTNTRIRPPGTNAYDGYALSRAVHAGFRPLVKLLLDHGAAPKLKDALAVRIAIKKRDLALVRALVERDASDDWADVDSGDGDGSKDGGEIGDGAGRKTKAGAKKKKTTAKRRRLADRVEVTTTMLRLAVESDARDIVAYFVDKGARPDMRTLHRMQIGNFVTSSGYLV